MLPTTTELQQIADSILLATGLACEAHNGVSAEGHQFYLLRPADLPKDSAFAVRAEMHWRRTVLEFVPDRFAGELLEAMGKADGIGRISFRSILDECSGRGAKIKLHVNDQVCDPQREETWSEKWVRVSLSLSCPVDTVVRDSEQPFADALYWSRLFFAAVLALLPAQPNPKENPFSIDGYAEGNATKNESTRYERDHRNRAASIAIWGCNCRVCGLDFGSRYGDAAKGFIHVHHTTPVSALKPGAIVNPARDLIPLCPNCHAVAHLREPPFTVDEIRAMLSTQSKNVPVG